MERLDHGAICVAIDAGVVCHRGSELKNRKKEKENYDRN